MASENQELDRDAIQSIVMSVVSSPDFRSQINRLLQNENNNVRTKTFADVEAERSALFTSSSNTSNRGGFSNTQHTYHNEFGLATL